MLDSNRWVAKNWTSSIDDRCAAPFESFDETSRRSTADIKDETIADIKEEYRGSVSSVVNFESACADHRYYKSLESEYVGLKAIFNTDKAFLPCLEDRFDMLNLANNHVLDQRD